MFPLNCNYLPCVNRQMCTSSLRVNQRYLHHLPLCRPPNIVLGCARGPGRAIIFVFPLLPPPRPEPGLPLSIELSINTIHQLNSVEGWWKETNYFQMKYVTHSILIVSESGHWLRSIDTETGKYLLISGVSFLFLFFFLELFFLFSVFLTLFLHADTSSIIY